MAQISRHEKIILAMTVVFLLVTGGWFATRQCFAAPYTVQTQYAPQADTSAQIQTQQPEQKPEALLSGEKININTADVFDLQRLPSVGEKRALAIIAYREEVAAYTSVEQLLEVSGIGEGIFSGLRDYVTVGDNGG